MEKEKIKLTENEEFEQNFKIGKVEEEQENEIRRLIKKYKEICAISSTKLGKTNVVKHKINTGDHEPIAQKQFRADKKRRTIIKEEVNKMLKDRIIKKSEGPWSSPVVIVTKKDGSARFCIDYRKINNITITDAHPLPRIDDVLEQFREAKWFSSIDLASGYWQIEMNEKDREKTAFTCHLGLFEFNVMPFGLKNAPPTFQRMMNEILRDGKQFEWTESQQKAFEELKEKLIQYPILSYPDYEKEFILITDASGRGLGAVLSQLNGDGKEIVIAYASRSLVQAEKNYL